MKRRLLLTGAPGCGKSALISAALAGLCRDAGGFVVLPGRMMLPARELDEPGARRRGREPFSAGRAAGYLREAKAAPFAVFDELGGEALADADYYEALVALLFAATPLIGVLRERPHGEGAELYSLLGRDPDTLILPTTGSYDINAAGALRHWTRDWALGGTF